MRPGTPDAESTILRLPSVEHHARLWLVYASQLQRRIHSLVLVGNVVTPSQETSYVLASLA